MAEKKEKVKEEKPKAEVIFNGKQVAEIVRLIRKEIAASKK